jgi:hypothetical protein
MRPNHDRSGAAPGVVSTTVCTSLDSKKVTTRMAAAVEIAITAVSPEVIENSFPT